MSTSLYSSLARGKQRTEQQSNGLIKTMVRKSKKEKEKRDEEEKKGGREENGVRNIHFLLATEQRVHGSVRVCVFVFMCVVPEVIISV